MIVKFCKYVVSTALPVLELPQVRHVTITRLGIGLIHKVESMPHAERSMFGTSRQFGIARMGRELMI